MELADLDVLIVDDHEAMRTLLARVFAKAGVERVRSASSGAEALETLRQRPANLILADNQMPGMTGLELLAAVRADPTFGAPKFIIVSGNASVVFAVDTMNAGADRVLVKPILPSDLMAAINALFAV